MSRTWSWLLRLGVTALALVLVFRQVQLDQVLAQLRILPASILGLCLLLLVPNIGFQYLKWRTLLRSLPSPPPAREILRSTLLGMLGGLLTPGRVGEHARVLVFRGVSRSRLAGLSLLDRLVSSLVTVGAGALCLWLMPRTAFPALFSTGVMIYGGASLLGHMAVLALLLQPSRVLAWLERWNWLNRQPRWHQVREGLGALDGSRRLALLGWAVAFWLCFILQFSLLVGGLGFSHPLVPAAAGSTFFLSALFPFSLGDLGLRELFSGALYASLGADPVIAISASLVLFSINALLPALLALPLLAGGGRRS